VSIGDWASAGSAAIAAASAVGAYVKWRQAKSVAAVATAQANRSVTAAERLADATERIAASATSPTVETPGVVGTPIIRMQAPWALVPIPGSGNVRLRNETPETLYAVQVDGFKVRGPEVVGVIHGFAGVDLDVMRIWHPNNTVRVTWHNNADRSDPALTWEDELPPRI
jgi:hypothetical protein